MTKQDYIKPECEVYELDQEITAGPVKNTGTGYHGDGQVGAGDIESNELDWDNFDSEIDNSFSWE